MIAPTIDEFESRARQYVNEWKKLTERPVRLGGVVSEAAVVLTYIPYFLATLYYGVGLVHQMGKNPQESKARLALDAAITRVLVFAPSPAIEAECRKDFSAVVNDLASLVRGGAVSVADVASTRFIDILHRHGVSLGHRDRSLLEYVVRNELGRLSG